MPIVCTNTHPNDTTASCPLCCEDKPASSFCVLSNCRHESCLECSRTWIEKAERSGQETLPGCAFCRAPMTQDETVAILGRPYQPRRPKESHGTEALDELTQQWLNEHCRPCPGCGACIEKVPGGCDMMECVCGFRFCYRCGCHGATCSCTPSHHFFWDNVMDCAARRAAPLQAVPNDSTGCIDLRHHIQRRRQKEEGEKTRKQRMSRQKILKRELDNLDATTMSAKWLFCSEENGFRILSQILEKEEVQCLRAMKRHEQQREARTQDDCVLNTRWLFYPTNSGVRMLKALTSCKVEMIRRKRARKRVVVARELSMMDKATVSAPWLFCPTERGHGILKELFSRRAQKIRLSRADARKRDSVREVSGASVAIENGAWIFQSRKTSRSRHQLDGLFDFQSPLDHTRGLRSRLNGMGLEMGWVSNDSAEEEEALENAINIRLLFLDDRQKKAHRAEIALEGL